MSWAACRQASWEEDETYCLMGIFRVNMPILYGEGREQAFKRLQLEIMRSSDDICMAGHRGIIHAQPSVHLAQALQRLG